MAETLTPEQKKQKRNEYARAYYAKRKAQQKDSTEKSAAKKNPKEAVNPKLGVEKNVEKLAERTVMKGAKIISTAETLVKAMADVLSEAYRTKNQELVDRVAKLFTKKLNAELAESDGTKIYISVDLGTRAVRIPKAMQQTPAKTPETPADDGEPTMADLQEIDDEISEAAPDEHPEEILADVTVINALREGTVTEETVIRANEEYGEEQEEDEDESDEEDEDLDEMDRAERDMDRDYRGRGDTWRELEAQGVEWD